MKQDHEHIEHAERHGGYDEEVDGGEIGNVVLEERSPGLSESTARRAERPAERVRGAWPSSLPPCRFTSSVSDQVFANDTPPTSKLRARRGDGSSCPDTNAASRNTVRRSDGNGNGPPRRSHARGRTRERRRRRSTASRDRR